MKLPLISTDQCIKALRRAGYHIIRVSGSHRILSNGARRTVVPLRKTLSKNDVTNILHDTEMSKQELIEHLRGSKT